MSVEQFKKSFLIVPDRNQSFLDQNIRTRRINNSSWRQKSKSWQHGQNLFIRPRLRYTQKTSPISNERFSNLIKRFPPNCNLLQRCQQLISKQFWKHNWFMKYNMVPVLHQRFLYYVYQVVVGWFYYHHHCIELCCLGEEYGGQLLCCFVWFWWE